MRACTVFDSLGVFAFVHRIEANLTLSKNRSEQVKLSDGCMPSSDSKEFALRGNFVELLPAEIRNASTIDDRDVGGY